jgi:hypothetical protein
MARRSVIGPERRPWLIPSLPSASASKASLPGNRQASPRHPAKLARGRGIAEIWRAPPRGSTLKQSRSARRGQRSFDRSGERRLLQGLVLIPRIGLLAGFVLLPVSFDPVPVHCGLIRRAEERRRGPFCFTSERGEGVSKFCLTDRPAKAARTGAIAYGDIELAGNGQSRRRRSVPHNRSNAVPRQA